MPEPMTSIAQRVANAVTLRPARILMWLSLSLSVVFFTFPVLWLVLTSLKTYQEVSSYPPTLFPSTIVLQNYGRALGSAPLALYFRNSIVVTGFTIVVTSVVSTLAAYGFSRWRFPFRTILLLAIIVPRLIPSVTRVVPLYRIMHMWGLLNTHPGLILAYIADTIPFSTWLLIGFFDAVPYELDQSAMIDGCGHLRIYYRIVLPVVVPGLIVTVVWNFIRIWNEFVVANTLMTADRMRTLPSALFNFLGMFGYRDWGAITAFTVLTMLPVIVLFLVLQRQFVAAMSSGALKG